MNVKTFTKREENDGGVCYLGINLV